ncbi:hypothetical protein EKPJFOCH_4350 [Methylobacterium thuringiense]|uniref:Transposase n=1 Tax=Methylobacterium thuringiense TaxID=1003091 RepID=A0ABQ4TTT2_9HYPH|nr:hypothetical protein EKPJFOCH_4350 [Methylobacterium thuringiense]
MIRLMLRAVGLATIRGGTGDRGTTLTPEEQLRRFAEVCERLSATDKHATDCSDDEQSLS